MAKAGFAVVTGAAGFIGSQLVDLLLQRGDRVLGLDNFVRGNERHLTAALTHPDFTFCRVNLENEAEFSDAVTAAGATPDIIWHMAANSDIAAGGADPDIDFRDTFRTTYAAAKMCRKFGIKRFAFASTSAIYGDHGPTVLREDLGRSFPSQITAR